MRITCVSYTAVKEVAGPITVTLSGSATPYEARELDIIADQGDEVVLLPSDRGAMALRLLEALEEVRINQGGANDIVDAVTYVMEW